MSLDKEIQNAFGHLKVRGEITFSATVKSVDKNKGTCRVDDGDIEHTDVRLASLINDRENKFYVFPKPESSVLVSTINQNLETLVVVAYSDVEEMLVKIANISFKINQDGVLLNGDGFEGIVKAPELKTQLDKMTARIDGIMDAIKNGVSGTKDGGAALHASIKAGLSTIVDTEDFKNIQNSKVKHG